MSDFTRNFNYLYRISGCVTDDQFGHELGLSRTTVNRLKNGTLQPSRSNENVIAQYAGIDVDDLHRDYEEFVKIHSSRTISSDCMIHALRTIETNLHRARELFPRYQGQYIVYTNKSKNEEVIASILDILRVTKNGIEFQMINPYCEVPGKYEAYEYAGYLMPLEEFLYFVGEQKDQTYEVLTMLFVGSGAPTVSMLKGLWTGVGVKDGKKIIASVPALAVKQKKPIIRWREALDTKIGYLKADSLPELVRRNISAEIVKVES